MRCIAITLSLDDQRERKRTGEREGERVQCGCLKKNEMMVGTKETTGGLAGDGYVPVMTQAQVYALAAAAVLTHTRCLGLGWSH